MCALIRIFPMPANTLNERLVQLALARSMSQYLGTATAAQYMRNEGWTLEAALWNLLHKGSN